MAPLGVLCFLGGGYAVAGATLPFSREPAELPPARGARAHALTPMFPPYPPQAPSLGIAPHAAP